MVRFVNHSRIARPSPRSFHRDIPAFHTPSVDFGDTFPSFAGKGEEAAQMSAEWCAHVRSRRKKQKSSRAPFIWRAKGLTRRILANMFRALSAGRRA
jgi:hypothetical protein